MSYYSRCDACFYFGACDKRINHIGRKQEWAADYDCDCWASVRSSRGNDIR